MNWCSRCGGPGNLMRVTDKAMVKCDSCFGSGKGRPDKGDPCGHCGLCEAELFWYVPHICDKRITDI